MARGALKALGHSRQERWLSENMVRLPSVRIGMGIGGSFDFISGRIKRAPLLLRQAGLEWLWRLGRQPWRIGRIFRAVAIFPLYVLFYKKQLDLPYRQNALGFILTRDGNFIIFQRCDNRSWQSPQGGLKKGEAPEIGMLREIGEEIGNQNLKILFRCQKQYRYDWPVKRAMIKHWRGQNQTIFLLLLEDEPKNIRCDNRELCGYKIVSPEEMMVELHPARREAFKILLKETGGEFKKLIT